MRISPGIVSRAAASVRDWKAAVVVRDEAQRVLGTYDYGWPSLAESTIAGKATGDSPGLETGAMRASLEISDVCRWSFRNRGRDK